MFAGMLQAIIAASTKNVPEPHIGSKKSVCPSQPLIIRIPAAKTSLIGAILVAVRYPLWCSEAPEVSKETRSEEHTSELQSRPHLVCRLLLEKKKKQKLMTS